MRKALGLVGLLALMVAATYSWEIRQGESSRFLTQENLRNLLTWVGLFGILSLAQAFVIITGGIDLSIGSLVGLVGITCAILLRDKGWSPAAAIPASLALAAGIGLFHGVLITKLRIQPFIVTLCGLFFYRGIARLIADDSTRGFGTGHTTLKWLGSGYLGDTVWPAPFLILLLLAALLAAFLHLTSAGRHIFALGASEEAARFSGVRTDGLKIVAYALCGLVTGAGALLIAFKVNSLGPTDFGLGYELYAIAGAVLGGCSLRGGLGNIPSVVIGATLLVLLRNLVNILGIPSQIEYIVIGGAILVAVVLDEFLGRRAGRTPAAA